CVCHQLGVKPEQMAPALLSFSGARRRLTFKASLSGITVMDDYAHHPTEIKALIGAVKEAYKPKRIIALFQPHRYSRTKELYKEFAKAFDMADIVYLMDIYSAGESPLKGISSELILNAMRGINKTKVFQFKNALTVAKNLAKGDILLTIGAGDVWKTGEDIKLKFEIIS
ncbi:MAG: hypothetical protein KAI33_08340, partial [Elusimicrobiales bacterium]|nr:hypothetical protein [Elusimicrobiales bacterium]